MNKEIEQREENEKKTFLETVKWSQTVNLYHLMNFFCLAHPFKTEVYHQSTYRFLSAVYVRQNVNNKLILGHIKGLVIVLSRYRAVKW